MKKRLLAAALAAGMLLPTLAACGESAVRPENDALQTTKQEETTEMDSLAVDYSASALDAPSPVEGEKMSEAFVQAASSFGFELLEKNTAKKGNVMVSPLSVLYALGMTANGARGETKTQMEKTLFGGISVEQANRYFRGFGDSLSDNAGAKLNIANSIWLNRLRGDFAVNAEFLSANTSYYDAGIFGVPFGPEAVTQINDWVSGKTDGMIPKTLNELSPAALMVLINTVLFDGKWAEDYQEHAVQQHEFTSYDGSKTEREMLASTENRYFKLGKGTGFIRPYVEKYSFVGILPDEGEDVYEYAASIDGAAFAEAVTNPQRGTVQVRLPSFTFDYSVELKDALCALGMPDAFSDAADFTGMGECSEHIAISEVIHKTRIELTKEGTKAAAVTAVIMKATSAAPPKEPVRIYLDRPFVFAIIDNESGLPIFCGIVSELK